ncbi:MAG: tetratricopeptide repeat protein [Promethearchaeota archaeon]|jgi:tetratricopeptide (TPR) repeat protein
MSAQKPKKIEEPEELIIAEKLIDEGKLDKAFILMNNFEQKDGITHHNKVSCHLLQCQILLWQGKYKELTKHAEQTYKESKELKSSFLEVDSLLLMIQALVRFKKFDEAFDLIKQGEELMKKTPQELTDQRKRREASLVFIKGFIFYRKGRSPNDADQALEYMGKSLALREELGIKHEISESLLTIAYNLCKFKGDQNRALKFAERGLALAKESAKKYYIATNLFVMAWIYGLKGEIDRSISFYEQSLTLFKELNNKYRMAHVFNNLSNRYKMRGELNRALECIEQAMALNRDLGRLKALAINHDILIQILIDKGDLDRAQISLQNMEQLDIELNDKYVNLTFLLDKVILLKTSIRARDRGKAEEILMQLLADENLFYENRLRALLNLCDLLLTELRMTNDFEVLDELKQFISQLLDIAEKSNSYWILSEVHLLQAKLSLLTFDIKKAQRFLIQAQKIAERFSLTQLAMKISIEHDKLLNQMSTWEQLKELKKPLAERLEVLDLNEEIDRMLNKRIIELPELADEEPVLLLIITSDGTCLFSNSFSEDFPFEEELISSFLTAFNTFSEELFSKGLDRARFGDYIILMDSVGSYSVCYLFKGQTYLAKQKLIEFSERIQEIPSIWQLLEKFYKLNQVLDIKDSKPLKSLITDIFTKRSIEMNI